MVGVLSSVPAIVVFPAALVADVSTGVFCRPFAPESESLASLAVSPSAPRSIPRDVFE